MSVFRMLLIQLASKLKVLFLKIVKGNSIQNATPSPSNPIEVESVGDRTVNLFDKSKITLNQYMASNGNFATSGSGLTASNIIEVEEGKSYTVSGTTTNGNTMAFNWFDSNKAIMTVRPTKNYLAWEYVTWSNIAPIGAKYLIVNIVTNTEQMGDTWQIEEGDTVTDYEPYGYKIPVKVENVTTNVYLDEPLRKVDIHTDYIDFKNQKLNREIKELKFTGYEDWFTSSSAGKHYYSIPKSTLGTDLPHGSDDILCTHFKVFAGDISALPVGQVCVGNNNINFNFDGTNDDIAGFETWLSQNDVKLYYPLSTPTETAMELPQIEVPVGGKVDFLTKIQPSGYVIGGETVVPEPEVKEDGILDFATDTNVQDDGVVEFGYTPYVNDDGILEF